MYRALLAIACLAACQDSIATPFPPGLEPFDDTDEPAALEDARDEALKLRSSDGDLVRVYGRGVVHASLPEVWAAAQRPEVMIAACETDAQAITIPADPAYELSFFVHYVVHDILTVEWDDEWRGALVPELHLAMIKHQKVQGSDFITLSEGSVQLRETGDPAITDVWFVEHLDAISGSASQVAAGTQSNYDRLVAAAHGRPLPPCR